MGHKWKKEYSTVYLRDVFTCKLCSFSTPIVDALSTPGECVVEKETMLNPDLKCLCGLTLHPVFKQCIVSGVKSNYISSYYCVRCIDIDPQDRVDDY